MSDSLRGRMALVTGGGRGIGEAIARAFADAGAHVFVASRTQEEVARVAASIGNNATALTCDVSDEQSVQRLLYATSTRGPVDILINNAGIAQSAPLVQTSLDDWNRMMAINATGAFLCTRAFLPAMLAARWGRVVNVASIAGLHGARYVAAYTASKHALVGLTRAVAVEIAGTGVTCNAVCPAFADTPMTDRTLSNVAAHTGKSTNDALTMVLATSGQSRLVTTAEVAAAVFSLCDVGSDAINGEAITIDGTDH